MAKSISLARKPLTPVDSAPTPPPAVAPATPAALSGGRPLPPGKAITVPARLTPQEREHLARIGWREGQPIPADAAEQVAALEAEAQAEIAQAGQRPPLDPARPPVAIPTPVPLAQLSPERQAALAGHLAQAAQALRAPAPENPRAKAGVGNEPPPAPTSGVDVKRGGVGVAPATPKPDVTPSGQAAPAEAAVAPLGECPHCGWDLKKQDTPEPSSEEKLAFLQSMLGLRPFLQEYTLMGGNLTLVFRTVTVRELDAIFRQCYREQTSGEILVVADFWERINRYRLYLQLQRVHGVGLDLELPEGYTRETNPHAAGFWEFDPGEDQPLKLVEQHLQSTVLISESLSRVIQQQCARFNRLVARLEALVDNADFWKETAGRP